MTATQPDRQKANASTWPMAGAGQPLLVLAAVFGLGMAIIGIESIVALAVVILDGIPAMAVIGSAALAGGWLLIPAGLADRPWGDRLIFGACLGIGLLSLLILGLGMAGMLNRPLLAGLIVLLALAGLARLGLDFQAARRAKNRPADRSGPTASPSAEQNAHRPVGRSPLMWLWLLAVPAAAIALLATTLPPGVLWAEEARGYDVLEYHLAVPKTFCLAGAVTFLPYNVYSNFPLNSEMLSLLMMVLRGDPIEAAYMCQVVNVALAGLFVAAARLAGSTFGPRAGLTAGLCAAVTPWLAYLSGIAYVETGMLAMGMAALAALLRAGQDPQRAGRWTILAGALVGLCCGFKYTAVVLIAAPLLLLVLFASSPWTTRARHALIFAAAAMVTFSPWMARNLVNTGNPVYPLAYSVFGGKAGLWDDELEERWQQAHTSADAEQTETSAPMRVWQRTVGDMRLGPLVLVLAGWGIYRRRDRWTLAMLAVLVLQLGIWLTVTHLFARFAVVMLLPLLLLAGRAGERAHSRMAWSVLSGLLIVGGGWNLYHLAKLYYDHTRVGPGHEPLDAYGQTDWFVNGQWPGTEYVGAINALPPSARVMLVGEARTFYIRCPVEYAVAFNHHPLAEAAERIPDDDDLLQWLRDRGVTHVLAHWDEIDRLKATYGVDAGMNAALFPRLTVAGLRETATFNGPGGRTYATLFEVPANE